MKNRSNLLGLGCQKSDTGLLTLVYKLQHCHTRTVIFFQRIFSINTLTEIIGHGKSKFIYYIISALTGRQPSFTTFEQRKSRNLFKGPLTHIFYFTHFLFPTFDSFATFEFFCHWRLDGSSTA
jgi:hypothetical protein